MSHILEAAQAEAARAAAGGGVYHFGAANGGGYAFPDGPVIVSGIRTTPTETDAQRADRLAREVGFRTEERNRFKRELDLAVFGDDSPATLKKIGATDVAHVQYGRDTIPVAWYDDGDDGDFQPQAVSIWICAQWVDACECEGLASSLQDKLAATIEADYTASLEP